MQNYMLNKIDIIDEAVYYNELDVLEKLVDYYDKQLEMEMCLNDMNCMPYLMTIQESEVGGSADKGQSDDNGSELSAEENKEENKTDENKVQNPVIPTKPNVPTQQPVSSVQTKSAPEIVNDENKTDIVQNSAEKKDVVDKNKTETQDKENSDPNIPKTTFEKIANSISEFFKKIIDGLKAFFGKAANQEKVRKAQENINFINEVKKKYPDDQGLWEKLQKYIESGKMNISGTVGESYHVDLSIDYFKPVTEYIVEDTDENVYIPYCEFAKNYEYTYQEGFYTIDSVASALEYLITGTLQVQFRNLDWLGQLAPFTSGYNAGNLVRDINVGGRTSSGYGYNKAEDAKSDNENINNSLIQKGHNIANNAMAKVRTNVSNQDVVQSYWNVILGALDKLEYSENGSGTDMQSALDIIKSVYDPSAQTMFGLPIPDTLKEIIKISEHAAGSTLGVAAKNAAAGVKEIATFGGGVDDKTFSSAISFLPTPIKNALPKIGAHGAIVWIIIDLIRKTKDRINDDSNNDDNWVDATFSVVNKSIEGLFGVGENLGKSLAGTLSDADAVNAKREEVNQLVQKRDNMIEGKYNGESFNQKEYDELTVQLAKCCQELDEGLKRIDNFFTQSTSSDGDAHMTLQEVFNANANTIPKQAAALSRLVKCIELVDQKSQGFFAKVKGSQASVENGGLGKRVDTTTTAAHNELYGVNQSGEAVYRNVPEQSTTTEREWSSGTKALLGVAKKFSWISKILQGLFNLQADVCGFLRGIFSAVQDWHDQNTADMAAAKADALENGEAASSFLGSSYGGKAGIAGRNGGDTFKNALSNHANDTVTGQAVKNFINSDMNDNIYANNDGMNPSY